MNLLTEKMKGCSHLENQNSTLLLFSFQEKFFPLSKALLRIHSLFDLHVQDYCNFPYTYFLDLPNYFLKKVQTPVQH